MNISSSKLIIYYTFLSEYMDTEIYKICKKLFKNEDYNSIKHQSQNRKKERAVGRELLGKVLFTEMGIKLDDCKIAKNEYGKPYIKNYKGIYYNISHSNDIIVLAFSTCGPVGIDVELLKTDYLDVMNEVFTLQEINWINSCNEEQRLERFFIVWTRKEAVIKAIGKGFSFPVKNFSVSRDQVNGQVIKDLKYSTFFLEKDYVLSIAVCNSSISFDGVNIEKWKGR
ncbi:4'-phosphopantetheinyl transferase family protein [Lysinibacillus sp. RS5]|uniref:4'-phosphopantetheinyl transferase family protein n=1 Tax=unclassified Lysinibacillus TaxID=2636778 RepID=UPI0035BE931A